MAACKLTRARISFRRVPWDSCKELSDSRGSLDKEGALRYELQHRGTTLGTGSFAPIPLEHTEFESGLEYLKEHPYDEFMHCYLLDIGMTFGPNLVRHLMETAATQGSHLVPLMVELGLLNEPIKDVISEVGDREMERLATFTPLIYIRWSLEERGSQRSYWLQMFADSVLRHRERTRLEDAAHAVPFGEESINAWENGAVHINEITESGKVASPGFPYDARTAPEETWRRAAQALSAAGLKMGPEARNPASLTPFALQLEWQLEISVSTGRHNWALAGRMKSYGKGSNMDEARASCFMEVVERVSAFAAFDSEGPLHYEKDLSLVVGRPDEWIRSHPLLNPNELLLEAPYENQSLHWIAGERITETGTEPVYVPAQLIFLFCNLDEISLTSGLPSTGLASGNTLEEAKLSALLEVIERDAERLIPYDRDKCFSLGPDTALAAGVLEDVRKTGVPVQFMDLTSEFGIPCYKAFIQGPGGEILKGCAAHLDGIRAIVSAVTELPYHPSWFSSDISSNDLPVRKTSDIPSYSQGNAAQDLALVETVLIANGYRPVYVNLTRKDLGIPVVKVLVPGLELLPEFHRYSPLTLRQFAHYFYS